MFIFNVVIEVERKEILGYSVDNNGKFGNERTGGCCRRERTGRVEGEFFEDRVFVFFVFRYLVLCLV